MSVRTVLTRILVTTALVVIIGGVLAAIAIAVVHITGSAVSSAVQRADTCAVKQAQPCHRLSPAVLAADTGMALPKGTKVLECRAGRYFPDENFDLYAKVAVPAGATLQPVTSGRVKVRDLGAVSAGRHEYEIDMRVTPLDDATSGWSTTR